MDAAIRNILDFFGLTFDTATMTLGDAFQYMIFAIFALVCLYLFMNFLYSIIKWMMSMGSGKL